MTSDKKSAAAAGEVSLAGALAIGIGGMVGGGIFAVLGLAAVLGGGATPVAFLIAGVVALLTAYSYAWLSVAFPSRGGTVIFIDKAFGVSFLTGSANNLLWVSYIVALALYAVAFGNYAATFFGQQTGTILLHILISAAIIIPALLNLLSAELISKTEMFVVVFKVAILILVIVMGIRDVHPADLGPSNWGPLPQIVAAGFLIIFAIVNAANFVKSTATGSSRLIAGLGVLACLGALAVLVWRTLQNNPSQVLILLGMVALAALIEALYIRYFKHPQKAERVALGTVDDASKSN